MSTFLLIISLFLFVGLVVVHEYGHFLVARRNGVKVLEFAIGFPPRAWHKKLKNDFVLSINWLPLGGFVRLKGEHDADTAPGSFGAANLWVKTKIMLAGVGMNLITAFVLLTILGWLGMPKLIEGQFTISKDAKITQNQTIIALVEKGSPAEAAGLDVNDQLRQIGPVNGPLYVVNSADTLPNLTKKLAGEKVRIVYDRADQQKTTTTTLLSASTVQKSQNSKTPKGYLGIQPAAYALTKYSWSAPIVALGLMKQVTILTLKGLGTVFVNLYHKNYTKASNQVTGPVGIFFLLKSGSILGYQTILIITAILSLALAIMNALPIPALDGGRLFVMLITRLAKHPLKKETEEWIHGTGFVLLLCLIILISIADVKKH